MSKGRPVSRQAREEKNMRSPPLPTETTRSMWLTVIKRMSLGRTEQSNLLEEKLWWKLT